jgi:hypothetical protein
LRTRAPLAAIAAAALLLTSCAITPDCDQRRARAAHLRTLADIIDCPEPLPLPALEDGKAVR